MAVEVNVANPHVVGGNRSRSPLQVRPATGDEDLAESMRQSAFVSGGHAQRLFGQASGEGTSSGGPPVPSAVGDASMASRRVIEGAGGGGSQGEDSGQDGDADGLRWRRQHAV